LLDTPDQFGLPPRSRRTLAEQGFVMLSDVGSFGGSLQHWQRA
jgi:hypothetical protein